MDQASSPPLKQPPQEDVQPTTQEKPNFRKRWPAWAKQLPVFSFNRSPNEEYELIDPKELRKELADLPEDVIKEIEDDIKFLDHELLRLFRKRDFDAKLHQNRYRLYQIGFMALAAVATIVGSIQAVLLSGNPDWVPVLAFIETLVALFTTYLATIGGRESPFPLWTRNRRHTEHMRREYFRYVTRMAPYDKPNMPTYERRVLLSTRVANINRGQYPDEQVQSI